MIQWHRIVVDAFIPDGANINISYVVSDNKDFENINKSIDDRNSVKDYITELNYNENINGINFCQIYFVIGNWDG